MKAERHAKILELIKKEVIETQEELTERLRSCGFEATQATVSRDIKELRLIKTAVDGKGSSKKSKYKYSTNSVKNEIDNRLTAKFKSILAGSIVKTDFAGNLAVLKTYSGMGQAAGAAIDAMNLPNIVGSVAGDDTLLVIMRTADDAEEFIKYIAKSFKNS